MNGCSGQMVVQDLTGKEENFKFLNENIFILLLTYYE
jgi:hypothetical protein